MRKYQFTSKINFKIQDYPPPHLLPNQIPTYSHLSFTIFFHPKIVDVVGHYSPYIVLCWPISLQIIYIDTVVGGGASRWVDSDTQFEDWIFLHLHLKLKYPLELR